MDPTDNDLMLRARDGDSSAFEDLVRRWEGPVGRVLARLAGAGADVEDLLQEVFLRLYSSRARYRARGAFSTWLFTIARNVASDSRRRRRARERRLERLEESAAGNPLASRRTADPVASEEVRERIERAIERLPEELRDALVLKHFGDLTFSEVARITGVPASTLKSRVMAALEALRKELKRTGLNKEHLEA
jgi:RNA polymerase sigma-70 factor (ECF subfamily)